MACIEEVKITCPPTLTLFFMHSMEGVASLHRFKGDGDKYIIAHCKQVAFKIFPHLMGIMHSPIIANE